MNQASLSSLSRLALVLGVVGCAPVDHVVASSGSSTNAAGSAAGAFPGTGVSGAPLGGASMGGIAAGGTTALAGGGNTNPGSAGTTLGIGGANPASAGDAGSTSIGTGPQCSGLGDVAAMHSIEVTVKNERMTPVFIGNRVSRCFDDESLRVYDEVGTKLRTQISGLCSCEDLMQHGACPAYSCSRSALRRIDPGSSITLTWGGQIVSDQELPIECQRPGSTQTTCSSLGPANPGRYRIVVTGSTSWACADGWDPSACSCMETNSCSSYGTPLEGTGDLLEPSVEFDLMSTDRVTVTFNQEPITIPMKGGIPIGDCQEPSTAELVAQGCPETEPTPSSSCEAAVGTVCRYGIDVTSELAYQPTFVCGADGTWGTGSQAICGHTCTSAGSNQIVFSADNCSSRLLTRCADVVATKVAFMPPAQQLLDFYLYQAVSGCTGGSFFGSASIEVSNGCVTRILSSAQFSTDEIACFKQRFEALRLDCAMAVPCSGVLTSTN